MKCSNCGKEFGDGMACQNCGIDRVTAFAKYDGYSKPSRKNVQKEADEGEVDKPKEETAPIKLELGDIMPQSIRGVCPYCGEIFDKGDEFCPECGKKLFQQCPKCQHVYSSKSKYCPKCGTQRESYLEDLEEKKRKKAEAEKRRLEREKERQAKERERQEEERKRRLAEQRKLNAIKREERNRKFRELEDETYWSWLETKEGQKWLLSDDGNKWLETLSALKWLDTQSGYNWLVKKCQEENLGKWCKMIMNKSKNLTWLKTDAGRVWLSKSDGKSWLRQEKNWAWLTSEEGCNWLENGGYDWLCSPTGYRWLETDVGRIWLMNNLKGKSQLFFWSKWLQSEKGKQWMSTPDFRAWLLSKDGNEWKRSQEGQRWQRAEDERQVKEVYSVFCGYATMYDINHSRVELSPWSFPGCLIVFSPAIFLPLCAIYPSKGMVILFVLSLVVCIISLIKINQRNGSTDNKKMEYLEMAMDGEIKKHPEYGKAWNLNKKEWLRKECTVIV